MGNTESNTEMGRRRAKFSKESLTRFLNITEYNDSLFDSEIKTSKFVNVKPLPLTCLLLLKLKLKEKLNRLVLS